MLSLGFRVRTIVPEVGHFRNLASNVIGQDTTPEKKGNKTQKSGNLKSCNPKVLNTSNIVGLAISMPRQSLYSSPSTYGKFGSGFTSLFGGRHNRKANILRSVCGML